MGLSSAPRMRVQSACPTNIGWWRILRCQFKRPPCPRPYPSFEENRGDKDNNPDVRDLETSWLILPQIGMFRPTIARAHCNTDVTVRFASASVVQISAMFMVPFRTAKSVATVDWTAHPGRRQRSRRSHFPAMGFDKGRRLATDLRNTFV